MEWGKINKNSDGNDIRRTIKLIAKSKKAKLQQRYNFNMNKKYKQERRLQRENK